jgi:hypothetical protein
VVPPRSLPLLLLIFGAYLESSAQKNIPIDSDTAQYWLVRTNDGNEFVGKIQGVDNGVLLLYTERFGELRIRMTDVKSMDEVDAQKGPDGEPEYERRNFHTTRGLLLPNGFGLRPGEAYYQNVWVLFNSFSVGITKNFSINAGTIPIYFFGANDAPFWIAPKISLPLGRKVNFGAGILYAYSFGVNRHSGDDGVGGGIAYGVITLGSRERNVTAGLGYGFSGDDFEKRPVLTFSTMNRLDGGSYIVTETYIFGGAGGNAGALISIGWRKRVGTIGLDVAGVIPVSSDVSYTILLPVLGISVPLGKGGH